MEEEAGRTSGRCVRGRNTNQSLARLVRIRTDTRPPPSGRFEFGVRWDSWCTSAHTFDTLILVALMAGKTEILGESVPPVSLALHRFGMVLGAISCNHCLQSSKVCVMDAINKLNQSMGDLGAHLHGTMDTSSRAPTATGPRSPCGTGVDPHKGAHEDHPHPQNQ